MKNSRLKVIAITVVFLALVLTLVPNPSLPAEACWVPSVDVYTDIAYTDPVPPGTLGNLLDLYIPDIPGRRKLPLLIWHSGSAWLADDFGRMVPPDIVDFFT